MTSKAILQYVKSHKSGRVRIAYADIDGILRGKYISTDKFLALVKGSTSFCDVVFGWDSMDKVYDNATVTGWHTGYPDGKTCVDLDTFRKIPWEGDQPFFLGEFLDENGDPSPVCPRQLLKKIVSQAKGAGFRAVMAQEFEWFNFSETPKSVREKNHKNLDALTPGMFGYSILRTSQGHPFVKDLFELLTKFGIPIEGFHTESGPGVLEAAIQYADGVEAGDRATLFKTAVKEIAYRHGVMATFMAKISEDLPGCGGHVHQSLADKKGKNLFFDGNDKLKMSELMRSYIAGQLHCLPFLLPMFAPTINSYKRLVEGAWAPTTLTWGVDNRTVALRAICSGNTSCRLETRVIGSDVNPYLAMAAALGAGLYGIRKKLKLKQPPTKGNGYEDLSNGTLPRTLEEATKNLKESSTAKEILGAAFVDHFVRTREWEWRQHLKSVTDWEYKRYFEII